MTRLSILSLFPLRFTPADQSDFRGSVRCYWLPTMHKAAEVSICHSFSHLYRCVAVGNTRLVKPECGTDKG